LNGILDLYNKLKQDYEILKDDIEGHRIAYIDTPVFQDLYISKDKIREVVNIWNTSKSEFATLPNGKEIILSDNGPLAEYLEELMEE
jgi:hypothetical protein